MEYCKLQIGCMVILLYIAFIYIREWKIYGKRLKGALFDKLLGLGLLSVAFDGATAVTVNNLNSVPAALNTAFHVLFLASLDLIIFVTFLYMLYITGTFPEKKSRLAFIFTPFALNMLLLICGIPSIEYVRGRATNYSMGASVYTCYIMVVVYILMSMAVFFGRWHYIESRKRTSIITYFIMLGAVTGIQMIFPETLITSLAVTVLILGVYMNSENPLLKELSRFHAETVMSFASLVENRDSSTGGHIRRTSSYVELIAEELSAEGYYRQTLTRDYITNLLKAAPMHDIGKISVPDSILKKPGRLTDEEFEEMKRHAENGGNIIREIFCNLGDDAYQKIAYEVARYHHEKWNGKGYPEGLSQEEIPLCARIMAVADVFDAVSENRCYRDALPLDECFEIIKQGGGRDFDPLIAEIFVGIRDRVEAVHAELDLKANEEKRECQA